MQGGYGGGSQGGYSGQGPQSSYGNWGPQQGGSFGNEGYGASQGGSYGGGYRSGPQSNYGGSMGGGMGGASSGQMWGSGRSGRMQNEERSGFRGRGPKGYQRSDERIREEVNDRLTDDPEIDATDIDVKVSQGEVTVSGNVPDRETKRMVEELVENCSGVRDVQLNLRVKRQNESERKESSGSSSERTSTRERSTSMASSGNKGTH
jgi:osmotically-inducible protein OsmY